MDGEDTPFLGVVCGLVSEAALLAGQPVRVRPVAGKARRAKEEVQALARDGARAIVSFGLAGGLAPDLRPGTLIAASAVVTDDEIIPCDPRLVAALVTALPLARQTTLAGRDEAVLTPRAKAELAEASGAAAVDMESHAVAHAARALGLPFAVLRAIADPAGRAIPRLALAALHADGTTSAWPVVKGLIRAPWRLSPMLHLAADSKVAHGALAGAVAAGVVTAMLKVTDASGPGVQGPSTISE